MPIRAQPLAATSTSFLTHFAEEAEVHGVAELMGQQGPLIGRAAIGAFFGPMFANLEWLMQQNTTTDIAVGPGETTATTSTGLVEMAKPVGQDQIVLLARYDDVLKLVAGRWKFTRRTLVPYRFSAGAGDYRLSAAGPFGNAISGCGKAIQRLAQRCTIATGQGDNLWHIAVLAARSPQRRPWQPARRSQIGGSGRQAICVIVGRVDRPDCCRMASHQLLLASGAIIGLEAAGQEIGEIEGGIADRDRLQVDKARAPAGLEDDVIDAGIGMDHRRREGLGRGPVADQRHGCRVDQRQRSFVQMAGKERTAFPPRRGKQRRRAVGMTPGG